MNVQAMLSLQIQLTFLEVETRAACGLKNGVLLFERFFDLVAGAEFYLGHVRLRELRQILQDPTYLTAT